MGTCAFTNSGGPGSKAAPCGRKSCAKWVETASMCCFKLIAVEMRALRLLSESEDPRVADHGAGTSTDDSDFVTVGRSDNDEQMADIQAKIMESRKAPYTDEDESPL